MYGQGQRINDLHVIGHTVFSICRVLELHACTPSVYFYLSLDSVKLHYPVTNKKKRSEYYYSVLNYSMAALIRSDACMCCRPNYHQPLYACAAELHMTVAYIR
jgi:hypothetical protein